MASGGVPPQRRTARVEAFIAERWDQVLGGLGGLVLAVAGVLPDTLMLGLGEPDNPFHATPWSWPLVPVGVILTSAGVYVNQRGRKTVDGVRQELLAAEQEVFRLRKRASASDLASQDVMNRLCEAFSSAMDGGSTERVTVYRHDGVDSFVRLARFSKNTQYAKSGRYKYPDSQGVVGAAWEHGRGTAFMPANTPNTDDAWLQHMMETSGIGKRDLKRMKMKSRSLLARRIDDEVTHQGCAVLMYESTQRRADLTDRPSHGTPSDVVRRMDEVFDSELGRALSQAVAIVGRIQPVVDPAAAAQEGF